MSSVFRNIPQRINSYDLVKEVNGGNQQLIAGEFWKSNSFVYSLTCVVASFAFAGNGANTVAQRTLPSATVAYNISGNDVGFGDTLPITVAGFIVTGVSSQLGVHHVIPCAQAQFTKSGTAAALTTQRKLPSTVTSFAASGLNTGLLLNRKVSAVPSAFNQSSYAVTLSETIPVTTGSFALSGYGVNLAKQQRMVTASGPYNLTGNAVILNHTSSHILSAAVATFSKYGVGVKLSMARRIYAFNGRYVMRGIGCVPTSSAVTNEYLKAKVETLTDMVKQLSSRLSQLEGKVK